MQTAGEAIERFAIELRRRSLRLTPARQAIFDVLYHAAQPQTVQAIADRVPGAHFTTIYRSVNALNKAGLIKQIPVGFKNTFELSDLFQPHHHHIICERCHDTQSIKDSRIEQLVHALASQAGLQPTKHHFEAYGICRNCLDKQADAAKQTGS